MNVPKKTVGDDIAKIHRVLENVSTEDAPDPLARCMSRLDEQGMRLTVARMPLAKAVWQAHLDSPVIVWCEKEKLFLTILQAGTFRIRLIKQGDPEEQTTIISRGALARRLGLSSVNQEIEVGIVHPKLLAEWASTAKESAHDHAHHDDSHDRGHHGHHMPPFRRFLGILRPERREITLLLVFAFFSGLLYLALPLVVDAVVTNLTFGSQTMPYFQALIIIGQLLTACLILQAFVIGFQYFVAELIQRRIFVRIAGDLAHRIPRAVSSAFDSMHAPELVNRFLDSVTVQKNTAMFLLEGINLVAATLIGLLLLALYHPLLVVFVAVVITAIIVATWPLGKKAVKTAIAESVCKYDLVSWFEQVAAFPNMFKGRGGYEMAHERTDALATQYVYARRAHFKIVIWQISSLLLISVVSSVALLVIGVTLVLRQELTLGQLVASELIMSSIVVSITKIGKKLEKWYDTMAAIDKLGHLLDLETEPESGEKSTPRQDPKGMKVEAQNMTFAYHEGHPVFENLHFSLFPGARACILGCQGSGVSSLLNFCFALRAPQSGYISFDGLDMRFWHLDSLRNSMLLLRPDEFVVGSVADNMRLGRQEITTDEVLSALADVGMLDDCMQHPDGMNMMLQVGGTPFSTRQRVALLIARAIVQQPRLLLIDEIFDGLDEKSFTKLTEVVFDRNRSWTVVVATRMAEVRALCDQIIEL